jgi:adenylate kinase family enzyme
MIHSVRDRPKPAVASGWLGWGTIWGVRRVVVVGAGGAGKSIFAARLGEATGLPVVELDRIFWRRGLLPISHDEWAAMQEQLVAQPDWILDGDLGPYDFLEPRLRTADTIVVLDFSPWRCAWRAMLRSREKLDFWRWLWTWRRKHRPPLLASIAAQSSEAEVFVLRNPRELERLLATLASGTAPT